MLGVMAAPRLLDRSTRLALAAPIALIVADFLLLFAFAHVAVVAVPLLVLANVAIATFATVALELRARRRAGELRRRLRRDVVRVQRRDRRRRGARALAVHLGTVRGTALMGACTTSVALAILLAEPRLARVRLPRADAELPRA